MKNARMHRSTIGAIIAVVAISALAGCTAAETEDAVPTEEPTVVEYTPTPTDVGAALVASVGDCEQIAGHFGTLTEGLENTLESLDETTVFCDWAVGEEAGHIVSIEILGTEVEEVPTADAVAATGGTIVEIPKIAEAGGIAYAIAGADGSAYSLTAVAPEYAISVTSVGAPLGDEQVQQIAAGVETLLG